MPPDRKARDDDTIQPRGKKKSGVRGPPKFLIFRSKPAIDADRVASQTVPPRPSDRRESAAASPPASKGDGRKLRQQRGDPKVATPPRVPTPRVDPRSKDDLDAARRAARDAKATRGDTVGGQSARRGKGTRRRRRSGKRNGRRRPRIGLQLERTVNPRVESVEGAAFNFAPRPVRGGIGIIGGGAETATGAGAS